MRKIVFFIGMFFVTLYSFGTSTTLGIDHSELMKDIKYLGIFVVLLAIILMFNPSQKTSVEFLILLIFLLLSYIIYKQAEDLSLLLFLLLVISAKDVAATSIIRFHMIVILSLLILTVLLGFFKVVPSYIMQTSNASFSSFGFSYPILIAQYITFIFIDFCLLKRKNYRIWHALIGIFLSFLVWRFTTSMLDTLLLPVISILPLIMKKINFSKLIGYFSLFLVPILTYFSFWLSIAYGAGNSFALSINTHLNYRPAYGFLALNDYPLTLFGRSIAFAGNGYQSALSSIGVRYFYIDNTFLRVLLVYGWAGFLIIWGIFFLVSRLAIQKKDILLIVLIIILMIHAFVDTGLYSINFSILPLLILAQYDFLPGESKHGEKQI